MLVPKEIPQNAPTLVYSNVPQVVEQLRDSEFVTLDAAAEALSVCVELIYQRETTMRAQMFDHRYNEAQRHF